MGTHFPFLTCGSSFWLLLCSHLVSIQPSRWLKLQLPSSLTLLQAQRFPASSLHLSCAPSVPCFPSFSASTGVSPTSMLSITTWLCIFCSCSVCSSASVPVGFMNSTPLLLLPTRRLCCSSAYSSMVLCSLFPSVPYSLDRVLDCMLLLLSGSSKLLDGWSHSLHPSFLSENGTLKCSSTVSTNLVALSLFPHAIRVRRHGGLSPLSSTGVSALSTSSPSLSSGCLPSLSNKMSEYPMAAITGAGKLLASSTQLVAFFPSSFLLLCALNLKRALSLSNALSTLRLYLRLNLLLMDPKFYSHDSKFSNRTAKLRHCEILH